MPRMIVTGGMFLWLWWRTPLVLISSTVTSSFRKISSTRLIVRVSRHRHEIKNVLPVAVCNLICFCWLSRSGNAKIFRRLTSSGFRSSFDP